jgi:hypothetical protein
MLMGEQPTTIIPPDDINEYTLNHGYWSELTEVVTSAANGLSSAAVATSTNNTDGGAGDTDLTSNLSNRGADCSEKTLGEAAVGILNGVTLKDNKILVFYTGYDS